MTETPEEPTPHRKDFICGVVEGFYGRPWTTEQRKDLFQKLNKWGMDMYVYAPKDDYKHRAYWRELYTVEEAEHLTSLISAAKDQGIIFCYALSPGLDITYSSQKEITTLKRKLEQVSQFGCTCFALLFDDIEPEMSEADKQTFQSFAHAQVSITNEIHQHLGCPRFLLCPTQYCASRAAPCVRGSEYLHTLGAKLSQQIDVMWTGSKVISKTLTPECIEEITQVLRRPPVIWDNLHANDYDQKRIFLGPYCGRSPELIPLLRGVLTNPNCEYNSNMIPIRTLAHWANCSLDAPQQMEAISWDIRLERENESGVCDDDAPLGLDKHVYHHRQALQQAITEWLPEFSIPKMSQGPVIKPQPTITVPPVPIIPIMPSVNTCMSLVTPIVNTATVAQAAIPTVTASQLQALADCCQGPSKVSAIESFNPVPNPVMNSLVSPTKVILNESIPNPIIPMANITLPPEIPVSTLPVPILGLKSLEQEIERDKVEDMAMEKLGDEVLDGFEGLKKEDQDSIVVDDLDSAVEVRNGEMSVGDTPQTLSPPRASLSDLQEPTAPASGDADVVMNDATSENGSMQVEPSNSPISSDMMVETLDETVDEPVDEQVDDSELTADDLLMLCDAFYLPFEHGSRGLRLLHDFHWLLKHAGEEVSEWRGRLRRFSCACAAYRRCGRRVLRARNRELAQELCPYIHDLCGVLALLRGFLLWCELGKFPPNIAANIQGTFTWFSKGWREAFESGAQEPWVFRGGLPADLRRLLPVECPAPAPRAGLPAGLPCTVRPYRPQDEAKLCEICRLTCRDGSDGSDLFPSDLQDLASDRFLQPYLLLAPDLCMVLEEEDGPEDSDGDGVGDGTGANTKGAPDIIGYACATLDWTDFYRRQQMAWLPEMREKYPKELLERDDLSHFAKECISEFHAEFLPPPPRAVPRAQLARLSCRVRPRAAPPAAPRLAACLLAALTAHGVTGVHAFIRPTEHNLHQMYSKLGFVEVHRADEGVYLTRSF